MYGQISPWNIYKEEDPEAVNSALTQAQLPLQDLNRSPAGIPQPIQQVARVAPVSSQAPRALAPMSPGSGLSTIDQLANYNRSLLGSTQNVTYTPEQYQALSEIVKKSPEYQAQSLGQQLNQNLFKQQLMHKPQPDLANPLLNLAQYYNTGQYGTRAVGENEDKIQNRIREWAKQTQDDQRDLSKTLQEGIRRLNAGSVTANSQAGATETATSKAQDPNQTIGRYTNAPLVNYGKWTKQTQGMLKADQDATKEAQQLSAAINGSPTAQREVPIMLTKMITGASRVPVQEAMMAKGDPAFEASTMQRWDTLAHGQISDENKQQYQSFINDLLQLHDQGIKLHTEQARVLGKGYEIPDEKINAFLQPKFSNPYSSQNAPTKKVNAQTGSASDMQAAAAAEIARRKKLKGQ